MHDNDVRYKFMLIIHYQDGHSEANVYETKEEALALMREYDYNYGHGNSIFTPIQAVPIAQLYTLDENGEMTKQIP